MPKDGNLDRQGSISAELARGGIASAISARYPELSRAACIGIESVLIEKLTEAISTGRQIGILEERDDGSVAISVFVIDEVVEQETQGKTKNRS